MHPHLALRQRAGFIGAEHIHASEILNRGEPLHDHLLRGHPARAVGKIDADDRRQQLRGEADGEREREEQRIEDRLLEVDVESEDREDEQKSHLGEQISEASNAALKFCFRRP